MCVKYAALRSKRLACPQVRVHPVSPWVSYTIKNTVFFLFYFPPQVR